MGVDSHLNKHEWGFVMKYSKTFGALSSLLTATTVAISSAAFALQPPSAEEVNQYLKEGTLQDHAAIARSLSKQHLDSHLVEHAHTKLSAAGAASIKTSAAAALSDQALPSTGDVNVLALLIDFADKPHSNSQDNIDNALFGNGTSSFPYESLSQYYSRSSYGKLNIQGNTLGWYTAPQNRSTISQTTAGRQNLIKQALNHYNSQGHDFSQYDNNNDGSIDYLIVIWAGERGSWASFWWGYQTNFSDNSYKLDGKKLGVYSWQWESYNPGTAFSPKVVIHETGHALGLPDMYDMDYNQGPVGGAGGMDIMALNWGDHNAYHKWLLGWSNPQIVNSANNKTITLNPVSSSEENNSIIVFPGASNNPLKEMFVVENRWRTANDQTIPNDGLIIWHIDGTQENGQWKYNNSTTNHKYMRLMEADGLEEVEQYDAYTDAGDFYTDGQSFTPSTKVNSKKYNGSSSTVSVTGIEKNSFTQEMSFKVSVTTAGSVSAPTSEPQAKKKGLPLAVLMMLLED